MSLDKNDLLEIKKIVEDVVKVEPLSKAEKTAINEAVKEAVTQTSKNVKDIWATVEGRYLPVLKKKLVIDIKVVRRKHDDTIDPQGYPKKFHYYIYYTEGKEDEKNWDFDVIDEGDKKKLNNLLKQGNNFVSTPVARRQKIQWRCKYPFTIYFGGTSVMTTDDKGWPRPRQIIPYIKAFEKNGHFETENVYIVNNALSGAYKYFVAVYITHEEIICVDDPENVIPPPCGG